MGKNAISKLKILVDCLTDYRTQILMYHNISNDSLDPWAVSLQQFAAQMDWLKRHKYSILSLSQALMDFHSGNVRRKSIVLTFDDGYADFLENAVPILRNHAFPATVFIVAGKVGGVSDWRSPELQKSLLNWKEIREIARMGYEIGSHGLYHRDLTSLCFKDLKMEINISKELIENSIGVPANAFSYPWGKRDARVENAVQEAGYDCAVMVGSTLANGPETNRFHLQRKTMERAGSLAEFTQKVGGHDELFRVLQHRIKEKLFFLKDRGKLLFHDKADVTRENPVPRITFGIIVLNGEPFIKYCLRQLYPFAHEIIVVEGAYWASAANADSEGHSIDNTLEELHCFKREEDSRGIVQIVTKNGLWESLTVQCQAFAARATGDYLWQVDVDEFYKPENMQTVINLLAADPSVTMVSFKLIQFCFGFDYVLHSGRDLQRHGIMECRRVFKWGPGYKYVEHEPPTVVDHSGCDVGKINYLNNKQMARLGIHIYHYTSIFEIQMKSKARAYALRGWRGKSENAISCAENWISLNDPFHLQLEQKYYTWLERFTDIHPPEIIRLRQDIKSGKIKMSMRNNADVERLFSSPRYKLGKICVQLWECIRSQFERYFSLPRLKLRERAKGLLRELKTHGGQ